MLVLEDELGCRHRAAWIPAEDVGVSFTVELVFPGANVLVSLTHPGPPHRPRSGSTFRFCKFRSAILECWSLPALLVGVLVLSALFDLPKVDFGSRTADHRVVEADIVS